MGSWGRAIAVPGLAALDEGRHGVVISVSCGSAGSCAAGGNYASSVPNINGGGHQQGFVVSESNGAWGQAIEVPDLRALNTHGDARVSSVSCASAGNCAAGGNYSGDPQYNDSYGKGYVVSEKNGVWGQAIHVPGLRALHEGGYSDVSSVSCAPPGNCAAGGWYQHFRGFVLSENGGTWGKAINIPGLGALNTGGEAEVSSVSCPPAGNCAAVGSYLDSRARYQGFLT